MTEWKELPEDARNVLEWLCCPWTGARREMTLEVGSPVRIGERVPRDVSDVVVDGAMFKAIRGFVEANPEDFEKAEIAEAKMVLLLGEEVAADLKM